MYQIRIENIIDGFVLHGTLEPFVRVDAYVEKKRSLQIADQVELFVKLDGRYIVRIVIGRYERNSWKVFRQI